MSEETLFANLGGAKGVANIVREMYQRVLVDPDLAPFFENVEIERLRRMQYQFVASALDGPVNYTGAELGAIHANRGITANHFAKFCGHFADAIMANGGSQQDVTEVLARLAMYKDKITGESNIDG